MEPMGKTTAKASENKRSDAQNVNSKSTLFSLRNKIYACF